MRATPPGLVDDGDDFFKDLPVQMKQLSCTKQLTDSSKEPTNNEQRSTEREKDEREKLQNEIHTSSYSLSNSSVVDDKGRRVTSMRRRYEDSTGRLKAEHERQMDGKRLRMTWRRQSEEDKGQMESVCSSGTVDEFETRWQKTPLGKDREQKKLQVGDQIEVVGQGPRER